MPEYERLLIALDGAMPRTVHGLCHGGVPCSSSLMMRSVIISSTRMIDSPRESVVLLARCGVTALRAPFVLWTTSKFNTVVKSCQAYRVCGRTNRYEKATKL